VTALVGRNGAGKSTLVMTVAGLLAPLSGEIALGDVAVAGLTPDAIRRLGIASMLEGQRILSGLTVRDNLRAAGSMLSAGALEEAVETVLTLFPELRERLSLPGRSLSGGQRQMLAIGQALVGRPRFLLVDELSLGLAPTVVKRLAGAIETIAADGAGILLIEQFTTLALALATDAYLIERGRIVYAGAAAELRRRPELLHSAYLAITGGGSRP
jgi:branched-chain amino acid transport system ATP-binding protein